MGGRSARALLVAAAVIAVGAACAPGASARKGYCQRPTGDWCYAAYRDRGPLLLEFRAPGKLFPAIDLCVAPPTGATTCHTFPLHRLGPVWGVRVRWSTHFPNPGPGVYRVRFRGDGHSLGPLVSFRVRPIPYVVKVKDVYVRNKARGYVIGTLVRGDLVLIQRRVRAGHHLFWGYGLVGGAFGSWGGSRCGWVQLPALTPGTPQRSAGCPRRSSQLNEKKLFKPGSFRANAGTGAVYPVSRVPCGDALAYGNYDPSTGAFSTPYGRVPDNAGPVVTGFGRRYVTADGHASMLKWKKNPMGAPNWFFMRSECLKPAHRPIR